ncbi:hypothetical protein WJX74_008047 [Apatococcus lobatus]|uniref:Cyclic nucleotide-binding domain-containing protein n=1 Tax=Apatococcus lobatus TaxID=904363 RepID=A0AAW1RFF1_9CHLO
MSGQPVRLHSELDEVRAALLSKQSYSQRELHKAAWGIFLPRSTTVLVQLTVMTLVEGTYTAFIVPYTVSTWQDLAHWRPTTILDLCVGLLFTLDIALKFNTALITRKDSYTKGLIVDRRRIAHRYMSTQFLLDILSTIPAYIEAIILIVPGWGHHNIFHHLLLRSLNVVRLLRILRLPRLLQGLFVRALAGRLGQQLLTILPFTVLYLFHIVYSALVLINLQGCLWLFTAKVLEDPHDSWLAYVGDKDLSNAPPFDQYIAAVYFAMTSIATVGYGDISARHTKERIAAMTIMFTGVLFFGFVISALSDLVAHMGSTARRAVLLRRKAEEVEAWLNLRQVPRQLGARVTTYFADAWIRHAEEVPEQALLNELPGALKGEMVDFFLRATFQDIDVFRKQRPEVLTMLACCLHPHTTLPGHNLSRQGSRAEKIWILQSGRIEVLHGLKPLMEIEPPALFGESCLVGDDVPEAARRPFSCRAMSCCMLWQASVRDLEPLLHMAPHFRTDMIGHLRDTIGEALEARPNVAIWRSEMQWIEHWLAHADSPREPLQEEPTPNEGLHRVKSMGPHIRRGGRFSSAFAGSSSGSGSPSSRVLDPEDEDDDDNDSMDYDDDSNGNERGRHHRIDMGNPGPRSSEHIGPIVL